MRDLSLIQQQKLFSQLIAQHITWLYSQGYEVTGGDWWAKVRTPLEHKKNSRHYDKCALDLNLFKGGVFLDDTEDHKASGAHWESLHPYCRWGGRFKDGNHYEVVKWR